ncbi:twin-arginine translocation signal domain-containing protein [bacterium]|nr:twin-arginine translocation signal domain-containing protein [bacterium]
MSKNMNRRRFLKTSLAASAAGTLGLSLEEQILLAQTQPGTQTPLQGMSRRGFVELEGNAVGKGIPMGKIGDVSISRLITGGNLIGGYGHSGDLIYVSTLLNHYFTEEKCFETWRISEENGINTCILNNNARDVRWIEVLNKYQKEGGKMQLIAQCNPSAEDPTENMKVAIDHGAVGCFVQGQVADGFVSNGQIDVIEKCITFIQDNGVLAGVGGHESATVMAVEEAGIPNNFYMKTFHPSDYWSFNLPIAQDTTYCADPEVVTEFFKTVKKPMIAYKVLAAGRIQPRVAFDYVFQNGADFVCVGMFDFQIADDVVHASNAVYNLEGRERAWLG